MGLNPGERQLLQDLLERVRRLENARAPSAGVGLFVETQHGVSYAKTPQPGFPAELTSSYDTTNGYSARRLTLQTTGTPGLVVPSTPETFSKLFTAAGDTTLLSGDRGWVEPLPDGTGYLFNRVTPAAAAASVFHARLTTSGTNASGTTGWKFVKQKLSAGAYVDDGGEVTGFVAIGLTIDGTNQCNPVTGLRVLMFASASQAGYYEFYPIGYADKTGATFFPGLVSLGSQTWEGNKTLATGDLVVTAGNFTVTAGNLQVTAGTGFFGGDVTAASSTIVLTSSHGFGSSEGNGPAITFTSGTSAAYGFANGYPCVDINGAGTKRFLITGGGASSPVYSVRDTGGLHDGTTIGQGYKDSGGLNRTLTIQRGIVEST